METSYPTKDGISDICYNIAFNDLIEKQISVGVKDLYYFKSEYFVKGTLKKVSNGYLTISGYFGKINKKKKPTTILIPERLIVFVEELEE